MRADTGNERAARRETINGLARCLAVIKALGQLGAPGSLTHVAQSARLPMAVARRCLHTLEDFGDVGWIGRNVYRRRILELGTGYLDAVDGGNRPPGEA
jgi:IclR family pca regulon transcriptional regulator